MIETESFENSKNWSQYQTKGFMKTQTQKKEEKKKKLKTKIEAFFWNQELDNTGTFQALLHLKLL